jgi:RNA polymerase sigma-70 factor (sigma-E family)
VIDAAQPSCCKQQVGGSSPGVSSSLRRVRDLPSLPCLPRGHPWQYGRLYWLGYLLTGDRGQAEDLAQEALVRAWWTWARVRTLDRPEAYVRKVLVNRHRSLLRRALLEARHARRTRPEGSLPAGGEDGLVLWAAVRRRSPRQRAVLVLRYHEDLTEAEVARLLRLPLGTVKTLARRGLARLRAELAPPAQDYVPSAQEDP